MKSSRTPIVKITDSIRDVKYRRQLTGFEYAMSDRISFLRADHWDLATANASVFLHRKILQELESSGPSEIQPHYTLMYREGQPVAAIVTQALDIDASRLVNPHKSDEKSSTLKSSARKITADALKHVQHRILVCGNLLSWGAHGVSIVDGEDPSSIWPGVAEAMYRIRRANKLQGQSDFIMLKDMTATQSETMEPLRRFRYRTKETEPNMILDLQPNWQCFDDYLSSLNGKYRKPIKNVFKALDTKGCIVERLNDVAIHDQRLHELYLDVNRRAKYGLVSLPVGYFGAMSRALGEDRFRCTVIRRDDTILGFVTTIKDGDTAIGYYLGMDYTANNDSPLYFRLLYAVIEEAIELGCQQISFGRTALEPKARLGCRPEPMFVWVRHRIPLMNYIVQQLLKTVPHDDATMRSPFKNS